MTLRHDFFIFPRSAGHLYFLLRSIRAIGDQRLMKNERLAIVLPPEAAIL